MAKATTSAVRLRIIEGRKRGMTLVELAKDNGVSYVTVQTLCARYQKSGEDGLKPHYEHCGKSRPDPMHSFAYRAVRCFKRWHPTWGASKIRSEILHRKPEVQLPCLRTIERWIVYSGQQRKRSKPPRQDKQWGKSAHDVWQIDAKEEMQTCDGQKNCWLNIKDEYTGAVIDPVVFPPKKDL